MRMIALLILISSLYMSCQQETDSENRIVTTDIDNFWKAYDRIVATTDSTEQYKILQESYLNPGTPGLEAIRWARRYTPEDYITAINQYPSYWESVREKTLKSKKMAGQIGEGVEQLRKIYPDLNPGKVYFEIGVFRTPGTTIDSMVLIGAEMALGDEDVNTSELPENLNYVKNYLQGNPVNNFVFLTVHEFIHTQQQKHDYMLIYRSVYEGIAEWVAEKATGVASQSAAINYGNAHTDQVRAQFERELYGGEATISDWLYNSIDNEFGVRDLGYYIGYAICEKYFEKAEDKNSAIIEMIDLDYSDEIAFQKFVDQSGYFSKPLKELKIEFEENVPKIIRIEQFENGSQQISSDTKLITIEFSQEMNTEMRGFDFGPLGEKNALYVQEYLGFSADGKSLSFEVALEPAKQYQLILSDDFESVSGGKLQPYLIDIRTRE